MFQRIFMGSDDRDLAQRASAAETAYQDLKAKLAAAEGRRDAAATDVKALEARTSAMLAEAFARRQALALDLGREALGGPKVTSRAFSEAMEAVTRLELGASGIASGALTEAKDRQWRADNEMSELAMPLDAARNRASTYASGEVDIAAWRQAERAARGLQVG